VCLFFVVVQLCIKYYSTILINPNPSVSKLNSINKCEDDCTTIGYAIVVIIDLNRVLTIEQMKLLIMWLIM
jgi:hypothetical protein